MPDPTVVPDERGEWLEIHNLGPRPVDLRGYRIVSENDAVHVIARSVVVAPRGYAVLARDASRRSNGGVTVHYAYGGSVSLANGRDWIVLKDPSGATIDSVAWRTAPSGLSWGVRDPSAAHAVVGDQNWQRATSAYGSGDRGTPGRDNDGHVPGRRPTDVAAGPAAESVGGTPADPRAGAPAELAVRVLDVGQGDAIYLANGTSKILVDGGPDPARLGHLLDSLGLNNATIDVVVLSHQHYDHHSGLRELFRTSRRIRVRFFFENQDAYPNAALAELRDSVASRAGRGALVYRDIDDPCADGRPLCTITMRGGARLHIMRPAPRSNDANNRSAPLKLIGPDSASFTMWLAGDAEHDALRWFDTGADYDARPGMRVNVLKADHHGSCNGVSSRYLRLTIPDWVVVSLGAVNDYGHMHTQAKAAYARAGKPWYRTDQNGTITIRSSGKPGGGYSIRPSRGGRSPDGPSDRRSRQVECNPVP
ncbi:MAG: lamin tail domain-containing protein [Gemmatimonadota bacterium]|nr:lamin tail domain-containing protein [Gemmatimonadota bacterium]